MELLKLEPWNQGKLMEGIFKYQKNIMDEYVRKGMLPKYPIDPTYDRINQAFTKKVLGWITEEIAETSTQYQQVVDEYKNNPDRGSVLPKLLNETFIEFADALHFVVELLVYSNIEPEDMLAYYEALAAQRNLDFFITDDALTTSDNYAQHTNVFDDPIRIARKLAVPIQLDHGIIEPRVSDELELVVQLGLWEAVRAFSMTGNLLKKRDWSVAERETPLNAYNLKLMEAWLYFMKVANLMGFTAKSLYYYYEKKNIIVQQRLIDKY